MHGQSGAMLNRGSDAVCPRFGYPRPRASLMQGDNFWRPGEKIHITSSLVSLSAKRKLIPNTLTGFRIPVRVRILTILIEKLLNQLISSISRLSVIVLSHKSGDDFFEVWKRIVLENLRR